jgi:hypothetical protein
MFIGGADMAKLPRHVSSEERLVALPQGSWTADAFSEATLAFQREAGLDVQLHQQGEEWPPLGPDVAFKYTGQKSGKYFDARTAAVESSRLLHGKATERSDMRLADHVAADLMST